MHILVKLLRTFWIPAYRRTFLRTRVAASTEHDHVLGGLTVETIVDIGANRGQFALCARRLFPKARIFSFEPQQIPAAVYRRVFNKDADARLFNVAIASESGTASMHVSRWDGSSSLLPIAAAQNEHFPFTEESGRETVATARLADCLGEAEITGTALLKIDVQGFEFVALKACEPLLSRFKYVYVEASFIELYVGQALAGEVVAYLLSKGFELIGVANLSTGASKRPIQADFLFMRRDPVEHPGE
ncbi:MAG: FkbM family methyltransferase [Steroidobacteraceae bacterium]|jgi:FkbM family methyltransferase